MFIDLCFDEFDIMVMFIGDDGIIIVVNDDSIEGGINFFVFVWIIELGDYIVWVRIYVVIGGGVFFLVVIRLKFVF